jgi:hypothetical protein
MSTIIDLSAARRKRHQPLAVSVESETDSNDPNRCWYLISAATSHAVQDYIDSLIAEVESFGNGGYGRFIGPKRAFGGDYQAMGWTVVFPGGAA